MNRVERSAGTWHREDVAINIHVILKQVGRAGGEG